MDGLVVWVRFELKPGARSRFVSLVGENARASVRDEPGCRRFDVLTPQSDADVVHLYEIYDDRAAFEAHKQTRHYLAFKDASGQLVRSLVLEELDLRENASA